MYLNGKVYHPCFNLSLGEVTTSHTLFYNCIFLFSFRNLLGFGSCRVLSLGEITHACIESCAMFSMRKSFCATVYPPVFACLPWWVLFRIYVRDILAYVRPHRRQVRILMHFFKFISSLWTVLWSSRINCHVLYIWKRQNYNKEVIWNLLVVTI